MRDLRDPKHMTIHDVHDPDSTDRLGFGVWRLKCKVCCVKDVSPSLSTRIPPPKVAGFRRGG